MSVINVKQFLLLEAIVMAFAHTSQTVQARDLQNPTNNFTTYQLKVPGSHDPITIIEDITHSSELSDVNSENVNRDSEKKMLTRRSGDHLTEKELVSISPSAQQRLNTRNQDVRATLSFQISPDSDKSNDDGSADKRKVTYSPSLLKKFIRDYSDKIKNADESTKNALKEIEKMNQKLTNPEEEVTTDRMDFVSDDEEIEQKYSKWNDRYSNKHQSPSNPYNDKDGWVTLEAVPWSSSKVSKWYPHSNKFSNKNSYDSPLSHQSSYDDDDNKYHQARPRPPSSHYHDEFNDDYIDDHTTMKPVYTSYDPYRKPQTNSHPQFSSWSHNQNTGYEKRPTQKPRPRPHYDYGQSSSNNHQTSYDDDRYESNEHWYDIDRNTPKPWSQDIITDNRPSDFPYREPSKRPHSSNRDPTKYSSDRDPTKYRPFSHPENGDGEWVLVSTTKGYQAPKRNGKRMSLSNNQPNDLLSHHSVKLTVLPPKNDTFSYDRKPMTLSHGGMLEVESSFESVEDSAALASSGNRPFAVKKRKVVRNVPIKKAMVSSDDGSAVLAAVGAGMVPATMAMLMPMMLGRRKRAVDNLFVSNGTLVVRAFK